MSDKEASLISCHIQAAMLLIRGRGALPLGWEKLNNLELLEKSDDSLLISRFSVLLACLAFFEGGIVWDGVLYEGRFHEENIIQY